jgi:hypothetical protein
MLDNLGQLLFLLSSESEDKWSLPTGQAGVAREAK